jgi:TRAP-type C4-dicarboxylate transport system permease small subunit
MPGKTNNGAADAAALARFLSAYGTGLEWVVGFLMVALALEVTVGIVFRTFGRSLVWYDEVASVMLAWLTFYGSALASVKRAHIGCPELIDLLPPRARRAFNLVAQLLVIGFFALLGWVGAVILPVLATDHLVSLPEVPISVVQSVIPVSAALILLAECIHLVTLLRAGPIDTGGAATLADGLH